MSKNEFIYYLLQMLKVDLENDVIVDSSNNIVLCGESENITIAVEEC